MSKLNNVLTVKELISLLSVFNENSEVYLEDAEGWAGLHSDCVRFEDNVVCLSIWDEHGNRCGD